MTPSPQTSKFKAQKSDNAKNLSYKTGVFDLEERMSKFSEGVIMLCRSLKTDHVSRSIVSQLVRSATSIGANYAEANNASSARDFRNKVHIAKKEAQETKYWLRMHKSCYPEQHQIIEVYWQEAHELNLMLQSIVNKISAKVEV